MDIRRFRRMVSVGIILGLSCPASAARAAGRSVANSAPAAPVVELFAGIESGRIVATVIPKDATRVRVQLENKGERSIYVRLPRAFAAVTAAVPETNAVSAPKPIYAMPGHNAFGDELPNRFPHASLYTGGSYELAPGKKVKFNLPAVRIDYDSAAPVARLAFRLVPLAEVTEASSIEELLLGLGTGQHTQSVVQLAVWHQSNSLNWQNLARLTVLQSGGIMEPRFDRGELQQAQRLVERRLPTHRLAPDLTTASVQR